MGAGGHTVALGGLLQVFVTVQATGIVDELFTALPNAMPVNLVRLLQQLHGRIHNAMLGLDPEVVQGIIVWKVTVVTGRSHANRVIAPVRIFPIGSGYRFIGVTTGTEFVVAGGMEGGIHRRPAGNHPYSQNREHRQHLDYSIAKKAHRILILVCR